MATNSLIEKMSGDLGFDFHPQLSLFKHNYRRHISFKSILFLPNRKIVRSYLLHCFRKANVLRAVSQFDHLIISHIAFFLFANSIEKIKHMMPKHISLFTPAHFQRLSTLARHDYFLSEEQFILTLKAHHTNLHDLLESNFCARNTFKFKLPKNNDLLK